MATHADKWASMYGHRGDGAQVDMWTMLNPYKSTAMLVALWGCLEAQRGFELNANIKNVNILMFSWYVSLPCAPSTLLSGINHVHNVPETLNVCTKFIASHFIVDEIFHSEPKRFGSNYFRGFGSLWNYLWFQRELHVGAISWRTAICSPAQYLCAGSPSDWGFMYGWRTLFLVLVSDGTESVTASLLVAVYSHCAWLLIT